MNREDSIFYKLTDENENAVTELLCNLFKIKYFRDSCFKFFKFSNETIENITLENISTQHSTNESGIPDIVIENNNFIYIIENKIRTYTDLQNNQILNYTKYLQKFSDKEKKLIFLIPRNYAHEEKIENIIEKNNFVEKYYWEDLVNYLYNLELNVASPIIDEGLNYFKNVLSLDVEIDNNLTPYEVAIMYDAKEIFNVLALMDKIRSHVYSALENVCDNFKDFTIGKEQQDQNGQGHYLKYKNNRLSIFVGLNPWAYEKENEEFVFGVAILKKSLKEGYKINMQFIEDPEWVYIKLDRKILVDENNDKILGKEILKILDKVFIPNQ